jgi:hypothetical protein
MTYATFEDMQQVKLGGRGHYFLSSLHFSTIIIPFFSSHLPFMNIYFSTILCFTFLYKHWYTYWHDSQIYKKKGFLILNDVFLMHIDSIPFPVKIWANYYHNNKRTSNEMNVVNTRTNILYIHGYHTRTNHNKMSVVTYVNPILENIHYHHSKPTFICQKFLEKIHAWLHEDMQQVKLGGMLGLRNVLFSSTFPFILHISSPH